MEPTSSIGGRIRPIAVRCTLRCLVMKITDSMVMVDMAILLDLQQPGYGIRGGAKGAVHAARQYLSNLEPDHAAVKLDFKNAFKSVCRDKMLQVVALDIWPFVHSSYFSPSLS